ncbi:hypothetical protein U91I_02242 [alpha proteobacterium U9-1i]|nr:hypothetical protein U91I_02242 [alpha proteobacterium U9-1i]
MLKDVGRTTTMYWVDCDTYFGPDRRRAAKMRLMDRRKENLARRPPALNSALRQLRFRVIDATGEGAKAFASRAQGVAKLAEIDREPRASAMLARLAQHVGTRGVCADLRETLYGHLDTIHGALQAA